jgi:SAM-dependent methyltransferase
MTKLQLGLKVEDLTHSLEYTDEYVQRIEGGLTLSQHAQNALSETRSDTFCVLDAGCGAGSTLAQLVRFLSKRTKKHIHGIGIDLQPLPHLMTDEGPLPENASVEFLSSDVRSMDGIESDSVDFGYSAAVIQYVPDAIRAPETGYRVLRDGGKFHWYINERRDLTIRPNIRELLAQTPGAKDVFQYRRESHGGWQRLLVCTKDSQSSFEGFPFVSEGSEGIPSDLNGREVTFYRDRYILNHLHIDT